MGLFDKKICDICGEKIGLLGNRKLDDGNLCKDCAKKLSPWFEERRHSTVEDIKRQLEYREKNKKAVMDFYITRQINTRNYNVFIDDNKGNFTVARKLDVNENPDIVPLSAIVQCRVDVDQQQQEETYTKDGEIVSYQPPVYKYEFDYTMRIKVRTQWFDDMDFRLNTFSISSDNRGELMEVEQTAESRMQQTMEQLLKQTSAPDKENRQMEWVQHMNSLKAQAEELVMTELIYS